MSSNDAVNSLVPRVFGNTAPYHLLLYSALLGTELFQTFVNTKVCFLALPRSAFTSLQKRLFPIYFATQTVLVVLSALTFPPHGLSSLILQKGDWIPYAVAFGTSLLNLVVYGPRTRRAMVNCIHQGNISPKEEARKWGQGRRIKCLQRLASILLTFVHRNSRHTTCCGTESRHPRTISRHAAS